MLKELDMKEIGEKINSMGKVLKPGLKVQSTKVSML